MISSKIPREKSVQVEERNVFLAESQNLVYSNWFMFPRNIISETSNEPTVYTKSDQGKIIIFCTYVDDMIYSGNLMLDDFKDAIREIEMTDLGLVK